MFFARRLAGPQLRLCRASSFTSKNAALIKTLEQGAYTNVFPSAPSHSVSVIQEERQQMVPVARIRVLVQGVEYLRTLSYKLTSKEMAEEVHS